MQRELCIFPGPIPRCLDTERVWATQQALGGRQPGRNDGGIWLEWPSDSSFRTVIAIAGSATRAALTLVGVRKARHACRP